MKRLVVIGAAVALTATGPGCRREIGGPDPTRTNMATVATAIDMYQVDRDVYPSDLKALSHDPSGWREGRMYLRDQNLADQWGTEFRYTNRTNSYELRSAGPDRRFDTPDDIVLVNKEHRTMRSTRTQE